MSTLTASYYSKNYLDFKIKTFCLAWHIIFELKSWQSLKYLLNISHEAQPATLNWNTSTVEVQKENWLIVCDIEYVTYFERSEWNRYDIIELIEERKIAIEYLNTEEKDAC